MPNYGATLAGPKLSMPEARHSGRVAGRDLVIVAAVTVIAFIVAGQFELSERVGRWLSAFEPYQLDEAPVAIAVMFAGLAWFSWRRLSQANHEYRLRRVAQEALDEHQEHLRTLFAENLSANLLARHDGRIVLANDELARLLGLTSAAEAIGRSLFDFYADPEIAVAHRSQLRSSKVEVPGLRLRRHDGSEATVIAKISQRVRNEGVTELQAFFTDVSALERVRNKLAQALDENRRLVKRSIELQEEERRHIARELHDEMGQWLNALKLDAVSVRDHAHATPDIKAVGQSMVELTDHVYGVARQMMRRLRPVALDELGLASALQHGINQWQRRHPQVKCEFVARGNLESLGETINITLYRLVQECLTNVAKHAQASRVDIALEVDAEEHVVLRIRDNGRGFTRPVADLGLGLLGLRERVETLGGELQVHGFGGEGVEVRARIPGSAAA